MYADKYNFGVLLIFHQNDLNSERNASTFANTEASFKIKILKLFYIKYQFAIASLKISTVSATFFCQEKSFMLISDKAMMFSREKSMNLRTYSKQEDKDLKFYSIKWDWLMISPIFHLNGLFRKGKKNGCRKMKNIF